MQTLIVPLIPELPNLLHTSASNASWAITATLLTAAVATPVFGRLGDMYGRVKMFNTGFAIFTVFSVALSVTWMTGTSGVLWLIGALIAQDEADRLAQLDG